MKVTQVENGSLNTKNSVFIAFYTDPYYHYQQHEVCKTWNQKAWFSQISLLGIIKRWDASFGFVGGQVDDNETLKEAAIRECKEEVGFDVKESQLNILCSHNMQKKDFKQNTHLFLCKVTPEDIYDIQSKSCTSEHGKIESSGFNVVHMVDQSFENLKKLPWAGTGFQEITILLNSPYIKKSNFVKT